MAKWPSGEGWLGTGRGGAGLGEGLMEAAGRKRWVWTAGEGGVMLIAWSSSIET